MSVRKWDIRKKKWDSCKSGIWPDIRVATKAQLSWGPLLPPASCWCWYMDVWTLLPCWVLINQGSIGGLCRWARWTETQKNRVRSMSSEARNDLVFKKLTRRGRMEKLEIAKEAWKAIQTSIIKNIVREYLKWNHFQILSHTWHAAAKDYILWKSVASLPLSEVFSPWLWVC